MEKCVFDLTSESLEAWNEASSTRANGWLSSFHGTDVDSTSKKKRRPRLFKTASRAVARKARLCRADTQKAKKTISKKKTKKVPIVEPKPIEPIVSNHGRTLKGRKLIRREMGSLLKLDKENFPSKPAFHDDGQCRLRLPGYSEYTWDMMLQKCVTFFEATHATRSRNEYSKAVFTHIETVKKKLGRGDRSAWMSLLRGVLEMPAVELA